MLLMRWFLGVLWGFGGETGMRWFGSACGGLEVKRAGADAADALVWV